MTPRVLAWVGVLALQAARAQEPHPAVYLTWQRTPTTTMTVVWHTEEPDSRSAVRWSPADDTRWRVAEGESRPLPHSERTVHVVELEGLEPDTRYRFHTAGSDAMRRFRTLPRKVTRPLVIAVGGDTMHRREWFAETLGQVARRDPDLVVFGGDLAYANGNAESVGRWYAWLEAWTEKALSPDGRTIPLLCAIGNHEVAGGFGQRPEQAPFFHALFPFPDTRGYGVIDLGEDVSLFLLNTHHTAPIHGEQTEWLDRELGRRAARPHLLAVYHVPGFPSHRSFTGIASVGVRRFWTPLFDRHGLDVAYENHDHTYKRTPRIKDGKVDPEGTLYLGDGCFGVAPRSVQSPVTSWWLAHTEAVRHFILTTIEGDGRRHEAIARDGRVLDRWPPVDRTATEALHVLLQEEAEAFLQETGTPGLQVALIRGGRPVLARGFGMADRGLKRRVTPTSVFQAASLSKPAAALGILRLVEEGKLDLDAPIGPDIGGFELDATEGIDPSGVTLRRILSHTAGLTVRGYPGLDPDRDVPGTVESLRGVEGSNDRVRVETAPGTRWSYSGGGYTLAQLLVEEATEEPFAGAMRRLVLRPAGMTHSGFGAAPEIQPLLAVGHDADGRPLPRFRFAAEAAAGLLTTAHDLARFLCVFMRGTDGAPPGRGLVDPETVATMLRDQTEDLEGPAWGLGVGLWSAPEELGGRTFGHGGRNRGFRAVAIAHQEARIGVVLLANGDAADGLLPLARRLFAALARQ